MSRRVSIDNNTVALTHTQQQKVRSIAAGPDRTLFDDNDFGEGYGWDLVQLNDTTWSIELTAESTDEDMDQQMFEKLAAIVPAGQYIAMSDEYGSHWRYYFDGTHCHLQRGTVTYAN